MTPDADNELKARWPEIRSLFRKAFSTSLHFSIASVCPDGTPHVTPIGSLILSPSEPKGVYFEIFTSQLRKNIEHNPDVCVLAVNSGISFWVRSLLKGRFSEAPAIRLLGKVGPRRTPTESEIARWRRKLRPIQWLKGSGRLWGNLSAVRDIHFTRVEPIRMGKMTAPNQA